MTTEPITTTTDHPPSKQRPALAATISAAVLGVFAIICGIIGSTTGSAAAEVSTMDAGHPVVVELAATATTPEAPVAVQVAAPEPAPAPAPEPAPAPAPVAVRVKAAPARAAAPEPAPEPAPAPEAAPAPPAADGSVEGAIAAYFPENYDKAVRVANCESHLNPSAVSRGGGNWGLFQINTAHRDLVASMGYEWNQLLDPYVNAEVARRIYDSAGGWSPWGCRRA